MQPLNLSIDFERYVDTSSDDENKSETEEEPFMLKKVIRKLPTGLAKPDNLDGVMLRPPSTESDSDSDEDNIYGADFRGSNDIDANHYDLFGCRDWNVLYGDTNIIHTI